MWERGISNIKIRTNKGRLNTGDLIYTQYLSRPDELVWSKRLWFLSDYQELASEGEIYYSLKAPADKYVAIYARNITVTRGLWFAEVLTSVDSYTPGTAIQPRNAFLGSTEWSTDMEVTSNVTDIVGGTLGQKEPIPGAGGPGGGVTAASGGPLVYPPGFDILLRLTNQGTETAGSFLQLVYAEFSEFELPSGVIELFDVPQS